MSRAARIEVSAVSATPIVRITDDADRATLEQAIIALRFKQERLPAHFVEKREAISEEIEGLVRMWLAAGS